MKKAIVSLLLLVLCGTITVSADTISLSQARLAASTFLRQQAQKPDRTFTLRQVGQAYGFHQFYIFDVDEGEGFVAVTSHDQVPPIVGYSLENTFDLTDNANALYWLRQSEYQLEWLCTQNEPGTPAADEAQTQWQQLLGGKPVRGRLAAVPPLIDNDWDQEQYYNEACPTKLGGSTHAVVGCAALSMAQVMHYWQFPSSGIGQHRYFCKEYGPLRVNFDSAEYRYDRMPRKLNASSSPEEIDAVSTLLYHCGVSVDMLYGEYVSSAYQTSGGGRFSACCETALTRYFDYKSTVRELKRIDYTLDYWTAKIRNELDNRRPVLYSGADDDVGGHAFVCDGYDDEGLFHFNWGWAGLCNGYYALYDVAPILDGYVVAHFDYHQYMIIGIEPNNHLRVFPQMRTLPQAGGTDHITIRSEQIAHSVWHVSCSESWVTLAHNTGATGIDSLARLSFDFEENNTGADRTAVITIEKDGATVECTLTQLGCTEAEMCHFIVKTDFVRDNLNEYLNDTVMAGWNFAALQFASRSGAVYANVFPDDNDMMMRTFDVGVCPQPLTISWIPGWQDHLLSYEVYNPEGTLVLSHAIWDETQAGTLLEVERPCPCQNVTSLPWLEDFENGLDCWQTVHAAGNATQWEASANVQAFHRMRAAYSQAEQGGETDHWLISPLVELPAASPLTLNFHVASQNGTAQRYEVYFCSNADTAHQKTLIFSENISSNTYLPRRISISGFAAQSGYLAFRHLGNATGGLAIDSLAINTRPAPVYTVRATSVNQTMGYVTGGGTFTEGTRTTVAAYASPHFQFQCWDDSSTENPRTFCVTDDSSFIAYFEPLTYTIVVSSIDTVRGLAFGGGTFRYGDTIDIHATARQGYVFSQWSDGSTQNPRRYVVQDGASVVAQFVACEYEVSLSSDPERGSVSGYGIYRYGTTVTITATPKSYYTFFRWSDGDTNNPRQIQVTGPVDLRAEFQVQGFVLTVASSNPAMGSVAGGGIFCDGFSTTISAIANTSYRFVQWNDGNTLNPRTVVVTGDITYTAYFTVDSIQVLVQSGNPEWGSAIGTGMYEYGTICTLTATPEKGYHFVAWNDGNTDNPRYFKVYENTLFKAYFEPDICQVTAVASPDSAGTVFVSGAHTFGATVELTAVANDGYRFICWDDSSTRNPRVISIESDTTITAIFEPVPVGIPTVESEGIRIFANAQQVVIEGANGHSLMVCDAVGRVIHTVPSVNVSDYQRLTIPAPGVYIVRVEGFQPHTLVVMPY